MSKEAIGQGGCLLSILAIVVALVIYPVAKWLFFVPIIFVVVLIVASKFGKDPSPTEIADFAERLLNGQHHGWDVDDYEHLNPRDPKLRELWARTMQIGGLPEEWQTRDEPTKHELRKVISLLRKISGHLD